MNMQVIQAGGLLLTRQSERFCRTARAAFFAGYGERGKYKINTDFFW
jgi:hypothetical protein